MSKVNPAYVNRVVAITFNRIATDMMKASGKRGELVCARGLFVSASDVSYRMPRDVSTIERNVEFVDTMLDAWKLRR